MFCLMYHFHLLKNSVAGVGCLCTVFECQDYVLPLLLIQLPTNIHPAKQQMMAQVVRSLPLTWETRIES